ncbi:hypothetical protein [Micromonospora sp. IBHARD004]|uniref:hypothetical protein n=1 Tax=Micromonospora sp. IBHARD004 TaxID=3457764 RepID=UPI004059D198
MALALSIYASIVSTGSLVVSWLAFRSGAPKVLIEPNLPTPFSPDDRLIQLDLTNRGRGAVTVWRCQLLVENPNWIMTSQTPPEEGPALPYRLEGHGANSWIFKVRDIRLMDETDLDYVPEFDLMAVWFVVELGDGGGPRLVQVGNRTTTRGWGSRSARRRAEIERRHDEHVLAFLRERLEEVALPRFLADRAGVARARSRRVARSTSATGAVTSTGDRSSSPRKATADPS